MTTEFFIRGLVQRGVVLTPGPGTILRVEGTCSVDEIEMLRKRKSEVISHLKRSEEKSREIDWESMRKLASKLGSQVSTGEPWGSGVLWAISPRGATVQVGGAIVTFDFDDVSPIA